jgi:hypothetical protein
MEHPVLLADWRSALAAKGDFPLLIAGALLVFPKLALGLSGFETGVTVMPLIEGGERDRRDRPRVGGVPLRRVANTKKLLLTAAAIMSVLLILSSLVTTLLINPVDYQEGGKASGRAIAFLAHRYLGRGFGTIYDASTILILGLAGASAMAGLLHLIPRYLPRFGMAPPLGCTFSAACTGAVRHRRRDYANLRRVCGGTERRLCHRRPRADPIGCLRRHARAVA